MARSSLIPGFRFHPTDVELVMYYLKRKLLRKKIIVNAVAEVNIYDFSPWDLPDKSSLRSGDLEWFFFCPKARKYSSGSRANRATETGFWKATGKDRVVKYKERSVAVIKTLVFHLGHAPNGERTDWVMHEYSMKDEHLANAGIIQDMYVLCKIFHKSGAGPKNGAQYGKPFNEEEWDDDVASCSESGAVLGPHGTINSLDYKQKDPTTLLQSTHAEPDSSTITFSANETTNTLKCKQKGPAITNNTVPQSTGCLSLTKPGSSIVTCSANETTNMPSYKRKGTVQSTRRLSLTEPGSSTVTCSANETTNMLNYKGKGTVPQSARSGSSTVTCSVDMLNCKRKETVPQSTWCLSSHKPGSSTVTYSANERDLDVPASDDDVLLFEEIAASVMGESANKKEGVEVANERVKNVAALDEDMGIYDGLVNLVNLDDVYGAAPSTFKTDGADYTLNPIVAADDLDADLRDFYVD